MARRWRAAACALALATGCASSGVPDGGTDDRPAAPPPGDAPAPGGYGEAKVLGRISDPRVNESSGLAASRRTPGLLWTHNDSGDEPVLYCLDLRGDTCGTWRVNGAKAFDWEDMAAGPGPGAGEPYLYVGDIGDNIDQRSEIVVYRIPEPAAAAGADAGAGGNGGAPAPTATAEALRLRYPDGPHDAEALLVHPGSGDVYVVTKAGGIYKAAAPLDPAGATKMTNLGSVVLRSGIRGAEQVTGGDISPDGRRVALSTYARGYELELPQDAADFDDVWSQAPVAVTLGPRLQGESVAYRLDGRALLSTSELVPSPLLQVERR